MHANKFLTKNELRGQFEKEKERKRIKIILSGILKIKNILCARRRNKDEQERRKLVKVIGQIFVFSHMWSAVESQYN